MKLLTVFFLASLACAADRLRVTFVDVEGGQATLIVAPSGEAMLIDAGWNERDAARIEKAAESVGVKRLDYLLVTHYHVDHAGGVPALLKRLPVKTVVDRGTGNDAVYRTYETAISGIPRRTAKPGDRIALGAVQITILTANGRNYRDPAAAKNPICGGEQPNAGERTENSASLGLVVAYGKFRFLDLGDILWNQELDLVCPVNPIGKVDVYLSTHHGRSTSGAATLVHAVAPKAVVVNNADGKGGDADALRILRSSPGVREIWQLHRSTPAGDWNAPAAHIANPQKECSGASLQLTAGADGSFEIESRP